MGYDLHITRADDWTESAAAPLEVEEWLAAARGAAGLAEAERINDGSGVPAFVLGADEASDPALYWVDGRVVVRGAEEPHISALVAVAASLDANLVGDDGELYPVAAREPQQGDGGGRSWFRRR